MVLGFSRSSGVVLTSYSASAAGTRKGRRCGARCLVKWRHCSSGRSSRAPAADGALAILLTLRGTAALESLFAPCSRQNRPAIIHGHLRRTANVRQLPRRGVKSVRRGPALFRLAKETADSRGRISDRPSHGGSRNQTLGSRSGPRRTRSGRGFRGARPGISREWAEETTSRPQES